MVHHVMPVSSTCLPAKLPNCYDSERSCCSKSSFCQSSISFPLLLSRRKWHLRHFVHDMSSAQAVRIRASSIEKRLETQWRSFFSAMEVHNPAYYSLSCSPLLLYLLHLRSRQVARSGITAWIRFFFMIIHMRSSQPPYPLTAHLHSTN